MNRGEFQDLFNWAWNDVWPNHLGQRLDVVDDIMAPDESGRKRLTEAFAVATEFYVKRRAEGNSHENAKHRVFEDIMRLAGKVPVPAPSTGQPLQGYLRIANDTFSDDTGPRCVAMCHAGDLAMRSARDWDGAMRALDAIAGAGYHGLRTWDRLRWGPLDANRPISGDWGHEVVGFDTWMRQMRAFMQACKDRNLRLHIAAGDLAKLKGGQRADYFAARKSLTAEFGSLVILNEWANESRDTTGGLSPDVAKRDMEQLRALDNLVGLTAYTGHENHFPVPPGDLHEAFSMWTPEWMRFAIVHGYRGGRWWDKVRHIYNNVYPEGPRHRRLLWQGEPFGPGKLVSVTDNKHELTGEVMALAAWTAAITGQVWTFFSSPGVVLGNERFEDQPGFYETPKMIARAEEFGRAHNIQWGKLRLMHGGAGRQNILTIASGGEHARIDQAIDDTKGVCFATVYGPGAISAKPTPGWTWTGVNPATAEVFENVDVTRSLNPGGLIGVRV